MRFTYEVHEDSDGDERYGPLVGLVRPGNLADLTDAAEAAAEDWSRAHGGWEADWPVKFRLYDEADALLGTMIVERDMEPVFRAAP